MALSLVERLEKYKKIYVRNMTATPAAIVVVNFRAPGRDKPYVLKIPPSPYPFEIFPGRLPESAIREGSDELLRFIEQGVLKFVSVKRAQEILANPEVRDEVKATFSRVNSDKEQRNYAKALKRSSDNQAGGEGENPTDGYVHGPGAFKANRLPMNPLQQIIQGTMQNASMAPSRAQHQLAISGVDGCNPRAMGLMASFMPDRDHETLRQLKAIRSSLTVKDFNLIEQRAGGDTQCGIWARRQMTRAQAGE